MLSEYEMHFSPEKKKRFSQIAMLLREWVAASRDDGKGHNIIAHHIGAAKRRVKLGDLHLQPADPVIQVLLSGSLEQEV